MLSLTPWLRSHTHWGESGRLAGLSAWAAWNTAHPEPPSARGALGSVCAVPAGLRGCRVLLPPARSRGLGAQPGVWWPGWLITPHLTDLSAPAQRPAHLGGGGDPAAEERRSVPYHLPGLAAPTFSVVSAEPTPLGPTDGPALYFRAGGRGGCQAGITAAVSKVTRRHETHRAPQQESRPRAVLSQGRPPWEDAQIRAPWAPPSLPQPVPAPLIPVTSGPSEVGFESGKRPPPTSFTSHPVWGPREGGGTGGKGLAVLQVWPLPAGHRAGSAGEWPEGGRCAQGGGPRGRPRRQRWALRVAGVRGTNRRLHPDR